MSRNFYRSRKVYGWVRPKEERANFKTEPIQDIPKKEDPIIEEPKKIRGKVLVIIPAYNSEKTILDSINSVLNQTYRDLSIVVIDDCSTDKTLEILKGVIDDRLVILENKKNIGTYSSINEGLYEGHTIGFDYFCIHDSDDIMLPEKIEFQLSNFNDKIKGVSCGYSRIEFDTKKIVSTRLFCENTTLYSKEVFDQLGYYDNTRFGGDSEYFARFILCFGSISSKKTDKILSNCYYLDNNLTLSIDNQKRVEYVKKYRLEHGEMSLVNNFYRHHNTINDRGIMLICFGHQYERLGPHCAESIRRFSELPIIVHTNIPEFVRSKEWSEIPNIEFIFHQMNDDENRIIKTQLVKYTKFKQTLYIDVDSSVLSKEFLYPFNFLNEFDIICPEWKTFKSKDLEKLAENSKKFKKFLYISKKFDFKEETLVGGGICFFNKNQRSENFFETFHNYWKETEKKEDMPGLNGALLKNKEIVKIVSNREFNNYNSTLIQSHHNSLINYEHMNSFVRKRYNEKTDNWEFLNQGSTETYVKPKIAFIYDIEGWAFYIMSYNLKKYLDSQFEVDILRHDKKLEKDYDCIICFSPVVIPKGISKEKIICGISSHKSEENIKRLEDFRFVFSNDSILHQEINNINKFYIENGVSTEFFRIERPVKKSNSKFIIGAIGSKKWAVHKGEQRIKEICQKLGSEYENKSIFVDTEAKILSQKEIRDYYSTIDVLVISSFSETGPNPLLEAMSCGIPVITNKVGLSTNIIDSYKDGILIEHFNSIDQYVSSIRKLKEDKSLYQEISNNSKIKIQNWDWSKKANEFSIMINKFIFG
jgi:glycosyltransferase involved in cell wall biosynthesis